MTRIIEVQIIGMTCAGCAKEVHEAVAAIPGVGSVQVLLAAEKALVQINSPQVDLPLIRQAVEGAGFRVPAADAPAPVAAAPNFRRQVLGLLALVAGVILFSVVVGEWLGLFDLLSRLVPLPVGALLVAAAGYPIFRNVLLAAWRRRVISHTLMSLGVVAALAVGEWPTALLVVFFMRVGELTERLSGQRARQAVRDLALLAPQQARVERDGQEIDVPANSVQVGEIVVVRPGERIPVDGVVLTGTAGVDQAAITGEPLPIEAEPGTHVFAATVITLGSLRVQAERVAGDSTFGRVITMIQEAEAQRADVEQLADRFSAYYLPVVATIAGLTFLLRQDPLATAAVLVVACSCSFALATPVAMLASIGAAARHGLLIKGGKYLEALAQVDTLLVDKTGTLTTGHPQITDIITLGRAVEDEVLALAATAEHYSEHPLAAAVRQAAEGRGLKIGRPTQFSAAPGAGVRATVDGREITVGNARLVPAAADLPQAQDLLAQGKTLLFVAQDGRLIAILAAADTMRPEVPEALAAIRSLGITNIELLTGDNSHAAAALAGRLGMSYRADLLPEDKIALVREYQAAGRRVLMVGDGVNDAPALAQATVGVAMGVRGTAIAIEAGHVVLLREDWLLLPQLLHIARRTMGVVRTNLMFTVIYNVVGLSLAAFGLLPPVVAAAAQSAPDLGILLNSARLLNQGAPPSASSVPSAPAVASTVAGSGLRK